VRTVALPLSAELAQILIYASPDGTLRGGMREIVEVYRELWALGYRPTVPVKFFMRQWVKKKKGPKSLKSLAMAPQYNPEQERESGVDHRKAPSTMSNISRQ
jgi:hypothetical protein